MPSVDLGHRDTGDHLGPERMISLDPRGPSLVVASGGERPDGALEVEVVVEQATDGERPRAGLGTNWAASRSASRRPPLTDLDTCTGLPASS